VREQALLHKGLNERSEKNFCEKGLLGTARERLFSAAGKAADHFVPIGLKHLNLQT
jgi:hypothetical protein